VGYFASVTLRLPSIEPEAVLASPTVGVRGFWQSGPHWIAHAGSAAEIDSREGVPGPPPRGLISWMRERAEKLFSEPWVLDLDGEARRPRMHGGFAFDPARRADREPGFWEVFPSARFVLPAYEVEADERGAWLTVTRRFAGGTSGDQAIDRLRRRATRTREQLARLERHGATPGPVPSATAIEELVDRRQWHRAVNELLDEIRSGRVRKVVLARSIDITLGRPPDSAAVLTALRTANPLAHRRLRAPLDPVVPGEGTPPAPGHPVTGIGDPRRPARTTRRRAGHISTTSYCSREYRLSTCSVMGLPMNASSSANAADSSSTSWSMTSCDAMTSRRSVSNWRASRRISRKIS